MHWKSIAKHALLLLAAGILAGFYESRPVSDKPSALYAAYFGTQAVLLVAYAAVFANLAYRVQTRPLTHALLATILAEGVAFAMLSLVPYSVPADPVLLAAIEYSVMGVALVAGTGIGVWLLHRKSARERDVANA